MKWFAEQLGYADDAEFSGIVGLLHDLDFEQYPNEHCIKAPELLKKAGVSEVIIHGVCSHGYNLTVNVEPAHQMEKVLYAVDELTGLIGAAIRMRPSKSTSDFEVKSLKKKFKDKNLPQDVRVTLSNSVLNCSSGIWTNSLNKQSLQCVLVRTA